MSTSACGENLELTLEEFAKKQLKLARKRDMIHQLETRCWREGILFGFITQRRKGKSPKLMRPWRGPYVVIKRINDVVYHACAIESKEQAKGSAPRKAMEIFWNVAPRMDGW